VGFALTQWGSKRERVLLPGGGNRREAREGWRAGKRERGLLELSAWGGKRKIAARRLSDEDIKKVEFNNQRKKGVQQSYRKKRGHGGGK